MQQLALLKAPKEDRVVNVASVPQRSPFRYPGGKTWLVPRIRRWLGSFATRPSELVEPFVGGGIVSLTAAFERLVDHVTMVELDQQVAAAWQTIIHGDPEWLADRIMRFELSADSVRAELVREPESVKEAAFQTVLKNRVFHGGIMAPGSGLIKHGEAGKGLGSRWYPETLSRRILEIQGVRDRIQFIQGDGIEVMSRFADDPSTVFFIDPPYTAGGKRAGSRLYTHCELDHDELFAVASSVKGDILLTYDDAPEVRELAKRHDLECRLIAMQNTHLAKMKELLIGRDLSWIE